MPAEIRLMIWKYAVEDSREEKFCCACPNQKKARKNPRIREDPIRTPRLVLRLVCKQLASEMIFITPEATWAKFCNIKCLRAWAQNASTAAFNRLAAVELQCREGSPLWANRWTGGNLERYSSKKLERHMRELQTVIGDIVKVRESQVMRKGSPLWVYGFYKIMKSTIGFTLWTTASPNDQMARLPE
ncbi:uncharacterized protein HMPREF1541_02292 [Cyphellophora europaea CBS 101466]|uniref:Uncharacterized protein n=1 Tax=Cyphellophora europaea (strain CBS 101466) TaxID=1220924 RepID=W2S5A2_CYPE1|nr:uncharacterized protein HMPREF1541_02292 [Cyphellophora europaea CBS 101466]ETN43134.1 hypothetical protein HMPREF1541_02292 [Cyphellophora europaea CBS 101466]